MPDEFEQAFKTQFVASISHEFRTPLSSLSAWLEIFSDQLDSLSKPEMRELLGSMQLGVTSLQMLVDNLLNTASIEAGHFSITPRPDSLKAVIAHAIQIAQPLLDRRGQSLSLTAPLALPPVLVDAARIRQVLLNLLMNASKYSPEGEPIEIVISQAGEQLKIAVADRGVGLPPKAEEHIFEQYVRLGNHLEEDERSGLGLGLSVVKAIVEGHGGQVGAGVREGGGAIFWFTVRDASENLGSR